MSNDSTNQAQVLSVLGRGLWCCAARAGLHTCRLHMLCLDHLAALAQVATLGAAGAAGTARRRTGAQGTRRSAGCTSSLQQHPWQTQHRQHHLATQRHEQQQASTMLMTGTGPCGRFLTCWSVEGWVTAVFVSVPRLGGHHVEHALRQR